MPEKYASFLRKERGRQTDEYSTLHSAITWKIQINRITTVRVALLLTATWTGVARDEPDQRAK